ncbi:MAG: GGDEF domain-containing protein, partial [Telmatospirillum sp.]|nr:GGDEF domain-containing protein [Telmatospirillum sp.]
MQQNDRVDAVLFRHLMDQAWAPLLGSSGGGLFMSLSLWLCGGGRFVGGWLALICLVTGLRFCLTRGWRRRWVRYRTRDEIAYSLSTALSGSVWGVAGLLVVDAGPAFQIVVITAILAMVMGAVLTLGGSMPAFLGFAVPAILPLAIALAAGRGASDMLLSSYCLIFLALMSGIAWRFNRSLRKTWQLRFDNEDLVGALTEAHRQLSILAETDGLTGLANRRCLDRFVAREWARAVRTRAALSVLMIDVDHFKAFNDRYGHPAGDDCLRRVAGVLRSGAQRATDLAARYGGEEFVIVLPDTGITAARTLATAILDGVAGLRLSNDAAPVGHVTVSVGVATMAPGAYPDAEALLRAADQALYRAKHAGRNRVDAASASGIAGAVGNPAPAAGLAGETGQ